MRIRVPEVKPVTYAERCLQLRDARYAAEDCAYRLRLAALELRGKLAQRCVDVEDIDTRKALMNQRQRASMLIDICEDFRDYMNHEEAWV